ncbi:MAG: alpha-hydroxy-acid oxidizing protein [Acidobacteria bacterium]|nr:alpha-hydroxy-acid oxidizing protein [Acidobacteriota bacterium]
MITRKQALRGLIGMFGSAPWLSPQDWDNDPVLGPINIFDFRDLAKKKLDPLAWDYLEGGSEDEQALRDSREAFARLILRPRMLVDTHNIDLTTEVLGQKLEFPIILDPAGGKNCFFRGGELEVAKGAAAAKALQITNGGIDELVESGKGPQWWQLTTGGQLQSRQTMRAFVKRLEAAGCQGICFTVDIMHVSHRERDMHNKLERAWCETGIPPRDANGQVPKAKNPWRAGIYPARQSPLPTWQTVEELRSQTKLPIILKGILIAEDAERAVKHGASAIIVSSHGARQLDHVGATIEALPECVKAVGGKIPVLVDGGFRRGTDILKGLALGAKAICIARPYLYGLTAFGQRGVTRVIELLKTELALNMGLAGVPNIAAIDRSLVRWRHEQKL